MIMNEGIVFILPEAIIGKQDYIFQIYFIQIKIEHTYYSICTLACIIFFVY